MKSPPAVSSPAETLAELIRRSGRGYTKIRHSLTQIPLDDGTGSKAGLLGPMVTERKRRSLLLYLLLITVWPWLKDNSSPLAASVWARALSTEKGRKWSVTNVSEAWTDLEKRGLIERQRLSRGVIVTPRREDGTEEYTEPGLKRGDLHDSYFSLPPEFWTDGWFETLSMPALAMLLALAAKTSREESVWLTNIDAGKWFGLSPRSVEAGLKVLCDLGLATETVMWIKAPLSPLGATKRHLYELNGPFSTNARLAMQGAAATELAARARAAKKAAKKAAAAKEMESSSGSATRGTRTVKRKATKKATAKKVLEEPATKSEELPLT